MDEVSVPTSCRLKSGFLGGCAFSRVEEWPAEPYRNVGLEVGLDCLRCGVGGYEVLGTSKAINGEPQQSEYFGRAAPAVTPMADRLFLGRVCRPRDTRSAGGGRRAESRLRVWGRRMREQLPAGTNRACSLSVRAVQRMSRDAQAVAKRNGLPGSRTSLFLRPAPIPFEMDPEAEQPDGG